MKKLLFVVYALAAISLLAPSAGFAQDWENRIGIYTTPDPVDGRADVFAPTANFPFNVYFVLTSPTFDDGSPVDQVDAFEFRVTIGPATSGIFKLSQTLWPSSLNIGTDSNPFNAEYAVGGAIPQPVANGAVLLMTWNLMVTNTSVPYYFYLNPTSAPAFPGFLAFNYPAIGINNSVLVPCTPSSGDGVTPVFALGNLTIPTEYDTFGGVKALFR